MLDKQDIYLGIPHAIGNYIGRAGNNEFPRTLDLADAADEGIRRKQLVRLGVNLIDDARGGLRITFANIVGDRDQLLKIAPGPSYSHRLQN